MTNTDLLREKIHQSGYRINFIAEKLGISYQSLLNKINNETQFKAAEIKNISDLLNISVEEREAIFFDC